MNKERESGIELLRIIMIFGIMVMHSYQNNLDCDQNIRNVIMMLGNIGVSCFVICSGFYSIKPNAQKYIKLEGMALFSSLISIIVFNKEIFTYSFEDKLRIIFPISGSVSWFLTCYMALFFISPFLNEYLNEIEKERYIQLIIILTIILAIIPTFLFFDFMGFGGKDIFHMVYMYIIGRYLFRFKEDFDKLDNKVLYGIFLSSFLLGFILNYTENVILHNNAMHFSRDLSIFIVLESICLFMLFNRMKFHSKLINNLARGVLLAHLLEWTLKRCFNYSVTFGVLEKDGAIQELLDNLILCICVLIIGLLINEIRLVIFSKIESKLGDALEVMLLKIKLKS